MIPGKTWGRILHLRFVPSWLPPAWSHRISLSPEQHSRHPRRKASPLSRSPWTAQYTVHRNATRVTPPSAVSAYMLLGELKGCDFANAELDRGSKVYIKTQRLGFSSGYETHTTCRKTSIQYRSQWLGYRMTHLLFFDDDEADNAGEVLYDETAEEYRLDGMSEVTETHFEEGSSTERFIAENSFGGVNVGPPVAATGPGPLTYTMTGTDAASFAVIEDHRADSHQGWRDL